MDATLNDIPSLTYKLSKLAQNEQLGCVDQWIACRTIDLEVEDSMAIFCSSKISFLAIFRRSTRKQLRKVVTSQWHTKERLCQYGFEKARKHTDVTSFSILHW